MKKTAFITGVLFFLFTAVSFAQTDTTPTQPVKPSTDQWNNFSPNKYKLQPMPDGLTAEKIFPAIGHYNLTSTDGAPSDVHIALDESSKGIIWIEGLPQGKMKAYLRKSPGTYLIPVQKTTDDKDLPQGVLVFNKDDNTLNVCIGCKYNDEDPASAFTTTAPEVVEQPVVTKTKSKNNKSVVKTKVMPVKTFKYSGSKVEATASVTMPMQQQ